MACFFDAFGKPFSMGQVGSYLTEEEEPKIQLSSKSVSGDEIQTNNKSWTLVATDQRLILFDEEGSFKDIDYDHIQSVDASTTTPSKLGYNTLLGVCVLSSLVALMGLMDVISGNSMGIASIMVGTPIAFITYYISSKQDKERCEKTVYVTNIEYSDNVELALKTDREIASKLSKVVRS